jgi:hypothetical protein
MIDWAGACGYLMKDAGIEAVPQAPAVVLSGDAIR